MSTVMKTGSRRTRRWPRAVGPAAALLAFVLGGSPSSAQYPSWSFEIAEIAEVGPQAHTIRLIPAPHGLKFPRSCAEFVIHARVDAGGVGPREREVFGAASYAKAIRVLSRIQLSGELATIGSFEAGFGAIDEDLPCEVASRGLAVLNDVDGSPAVYSVY